MEPRLTERSCGLGDSRGRPGIVGMPKAESFRASQRIWYARHTLVAGTGPKREHFGELIRSYVLSDGSLVLAWQSRESR